MSIKFSQIVNESVKELFLFLTPETSVFSVDVPHLSEEPIIEGIIPIQGKNYRKNPLFVHYLNNIPVENRQNYNCDCCYNFVKKYGSLAYLDGEYRIKSLLWSNYKEGRHFEKSFSEMAKTVEASKIRFGYTSDRTDHGFAEKGNHEHFFFEHEFVKFKNGERKIGDMISKTIQDHKLLTSTFVKYISKEYKEALDVASILFKDHVRVKLRQKQKHTLEQFISLFEEWSTQGLSSSQKSNVIWEIVTTKTPDIINFKNGVIGNFIDNLVEGDIDKAIASFISQTSAEKYLRPTTLPSKMELEKAKKDFEELGLYDSLKFKPAVIDDITKSRIIWSDVSLTENETKEESNPFDSVDVKENQKTNKPLYGLTVNGGEIHLNTFMSDILPKAKKITLEIPHAYNSFIFIACMANKEAKPILRYDLLENRDQVVFYRISREYQYISRESLSLKNNVSVVSVCNANDDVSIFLFETNKTKVKTGTPLFPEILIPELHKHRAVIENYCKKTEINTSDVENLAMGLPCRGANIVVDYGDHRTLYRISSVL